MSWLRYKRVRLLLSFFFLLFFYFPNIIAVGSFKLTYMKWKPYQAFFMCRRISNKTSYWEAMHTILSRNSVEQNCSHSFPFWLVSHCLHHYIINFFVLAVLQSWTTSFPPFFHSLSLLVLCFWIRLHEICSNSGFRFYPNISEGFTDVIKSKSSFLPAAG